MNTSEAPNINVDDCYLLVVDDNDHLNNIKQELELGSDVLNDLDNIKQELELGSDVDDFNNIKHELEIDSDDILYDTDEGEEENEVSYFTNTEDDNNGIKLGVFEDNGHGDYIMNLKSDLSKSSEDDDDSQSSVKVKKKHRNHSKRKKGVEISHHSFVEDLRKQEPSLRDDEEKLIEKLVKVMKTCKPQEPPDYFVRKNYECFFCGLKNKMLYTAKRHYEEVHGPKYLMCYACGEKFRSRSCLHRHEKKFCSAVDIDIVLKARAISVGRRGTNRPFLDPNLKLQKRVKKRYPIKKKWHDCTECTAKFLSRVSLVAHMNVHNGVRPYRCEYCPAAYTTKPNLKRHIKSHNPDKFICDYCGKELHHRQSIIDHVKLHMFEKRFVCEFDGCDKRYSDKNAWQRHIEVVHQKLPVRFPCTLCDKRLGTAGRLKKHMKKFHNLEFMNRIMFHRALPKMSEEAIQSNAPFMNDKAVLITNEIEEEAKYKISEYLDSS